MSFKLAAGLSLALASPLVAGTQVLAAQDEAFFKTVVGQWTGPGEIVAGKYKGTKFVCSFAGETPASAVGMALDGSCRVGLLSQKMRAEVKRQGTGYSGAFMDGASGKGLDIVAGTVDGNVVVLTLDRKQLKGAMVARLKDKDTMNVTVSVRLDDELVPVIGMNLKRGEAPVKQTALEP